MSRTLTFVGLDVHKESIDVAVAQLDGEVQHLGVIANEPEAIRKRIGRLGPKAYPQVCCEAGPCGYVIERQLKKVGVSCVVVAPSLVPSKPGERIKTDRRDALKLIAQMPANWTCLLRKRCPLAHNTLNPGESERHKPNASMRPTVSGQHEHVDSL